jgi:hypothetical protein
VWRKLSSARCVEAQLDAIESGRETIDSDETIDSGREAKPLSIE